MSLPPLEPISKYDPTRYIDEIFSIFDKDIANGGLSLLGLPIKCIWHKPSDNKHFSFWHIFSEKGETDLEEDRIPSIERCEKVRWIPYIIKNAMDDDLVWCWEKSVRTGRGRNTHVLLYLHQEKFLVVFRRKANRLELVTAYPKHNYKKMQKERARYLDPR